MGLNRIKYHEAINITLHHLMELDESIVIIGACCINSPWYVGNTCNGLLEKFGENRVIDGPVSENAVTGIAIGMALSGLKPILIFPRMDFMMYAMDPIVNQAAKWSYMFGGKSNVPIVIWSIINRKGCQGAQHSQDFTWLFANIPGLKVVSPKTTNDVQRVLMASVYDKNPVIFVDDRERYDKTGYIEGWHNQHILRDEDIIRGSENPWCPAPCSESLERKFYESPIY